MHLLCINYQQREHRRNNDVSSSAFSFPLLSFPARDVTSPEPVLFFCRHAAGHVLCERSSPGQASLDSGRPGDLLLQVSAPLVDHLCLPFSAVWLLLTALMPWASCHRCSLFQMSVNWCWLNVLCASTLRQQPQVRFAIRCQGMCRIPLPRRKGEVV